MTSRATRGRCSEQSRPSRPTRGIHRFRRRTEPWALDALAFVGASELAGLVEAARLAEPGDPLVRGDELGLAPGPEIGRILAIIDEERAAGTISTREEALDARAPPRRRRGRVVSVDLRIALQEQRAPETADRVRRLLAPFTGSERALDSGCGTGAIAFALAPHVGEVVGADMRLEYLEAARERAPENVSFVEGDAMALPFDYASFDIAACVRMLHHVHRPELAVSELARVTRPGGRILSRISSGPSTRS